MKFEALGDIAEFVLDGTHGSPARVEEGVPVLSAQNVKNGVLSYETTRFTTAAELRAFESRLKIAVGDVLLTIVGTIGRAAVVRETKALVFQRSVAVIRTKRQVLDPDYLFHATQSAGFKSQLRRSTNQSSQAGIYLGKLKKIQIPLPPLDAQRRIAAILDQADALRAKRRDALAHLDDLTQSIFLDMFGNPGKNERAWPLRPMSELFRSSPNYGTMIPGTAEPRPWLCLRVANIQGWALDLTSTKYVRLPPEAVERHGVLDGDMLLARAIASQDHLGKSVVVHPGSEHWAFDSHLMRLRFDPAQARPEFIRQLLRTRGGRARFLAVTRRSAVQFNINTREIKALELPIPPIESQVDFLERVAAVETVMEASSFQSRDLDSLFASLQSRAFSGRL